MSKPKSTKDILHSSNCAPATKTVMEVTFLFGMLPSGINLGPFTAFPSLVRLNCIIPCTPSAMYNLFLV